LATSTDFDDYWPFYQQPLKFLSREKSEIRLSLCNAYTTKKQEWWVDCFYSVEWQLSS